MARQGSLRHFARKNHPKVTVGVWLRIFTIVYLTFDIPAALKADDPGPDSFFGLSPTSSNPTASDAPVLKEPSTEVWQFDIEPATRIVEVDSPIQIKLNAVHWPEFASSLASITCQLQRVPDLTTVSTQTLSVTLDNRGDSASIQANIIAPPQPGVYEIKANVTPSGDSAWLKWRRTLQSNLSHSQPILVTRSPASSPSPDDTDAAWRLISTIRPFESLGWRLTEFIPATRERLIPFISTPFKTNPVAVTHHGEKISEIPAQESVEYPLPVMQSHRPHVISLKYAATGSKRYQVNVIGAGGHILQSFTVVDPSDAIDHPDFVTHWFVTYPPKSECVIRLINLSSQQAMRLHSISVQAGPEHLYSSTGPATAAPTMTALTISDPKWVEKRTEDLISDAGFSRLSPQTASLWRTWVAAERLGEYAGAIGMKRVIVPARFAAYGPNAKDKNSSVIDQESSISDAMLHRAMLEGIKQSGSSGMFQIEPLETDFRDSQQLAERIQQFQGEFKDPQLTFGSYLNFQNWNSTSSNDANLDSIAELNDGLVAGLAEIIMNSPRPILLRLPARFDAERAHAQLLAKCDAEKFTLLSVHARDRTGSLSSRLATARALNNISSVQNKHSGTLGLLIVQVNSDDQIAASGIDGSLTMDLSRCVEKLRPRVILLDVDATTSGIEPMLAANLRLFGSLSMNRLQSMDDNESAQRTVRMYRDPVQKLAMAINLAPWRNELHSSTASVTEIPSANHSDLILFGQPGKSTNDRSIDPSKSTVQLAPGECRLVQWLGNNPVDTWSISPASGENVVKKIQLAVTQVIEQMGALSNPPDYPGLTNGGFEHPSAVGISGWLGAQHPVDAVKLDSDAIEGKQSVCLTMGRDGTRTWLVSETIQSPRSGRLAISMAVRGELVGTTSPTSRADVTATSALANERAPHRIRIALEGTKKNSPIRHATELEVARDGRWSARRIVLELDGIEPTQTDGFRLTIDSLSIGKVWIDDVHIHDWFPTESERHELQSQSFLAAQGLQRGNLVPAARLLRNEWATYLMLEVPHRAPVKTTSDSKVEPTVQPPPQAGVADRFRQWLPRPLRF